MIEFVLNPTSVRGTRVRTFAGTIEVETLGVQGRRDCDSVGKRLGVSSAPVTSLHNRCLVCLTRYVFPHIEVSVYPHLSPPVRRNTSSAGCPAAYAAVTILCRSICCRWWWLCGCASVVVVLFFCSVLLPLSAIVLVAVHWSILRRK